MSIEEYILAMPKAELRIHLEGIFRAQTLLLIAEQNEVQSNVKKFDNWVELINSPDAKRMDETVKQAASWLQIPEDISRIVYDLGVMLSKQNIKYVEVAVNPALHQQSSMSFDDFMEALNDGRDRAQRGWGIQIKWLLNISREEPRRADEIVRWATNVTGRKSGVAGIILTGDETAQPIGQFVRAFTTAHKKDCPTVATIGDKLDADGVQTTIEELEPERLAGVPNLETSPELIKMVSDNNISVDLCLAQAVQLKWTDSYETHPVRKLYDENIVVTISSLMPSYFGETLNDAYLRLVNECGMSLEELEEIALNAVKCSFLPDEEKQELLNTFESAYVDLKETYITSASA